MPWRGDEVSEGKSKAGGGQGGGGADGVVHGDAAVDEVPGVRQGHEVEQEVWGPGHGPVVMWLGGGGENNCQHQDALAPLTENSLEGGGENAGLWAPGRVRGAWPGARPRIDGGGGRREGWVAIGSVGWIVCADPTFIELLIAAETSRTDPTTLDEPSGFSNSPNNIEPACFYLGA